MATSQEQENQFYEERRRVANILANKTLKDNPNVTYGDLLSPNELELGAHLAEPSLNDLALSFNLYTPSEIDEIKQAMTKQFETRVAPYNRAPIDYDMREFHPEYMRILDEWNSPEAQKRRELQQLRYNQPPETPPSEPWGIDRARKITSLGFDPRNELQFDDFGEGAAFRTKIAFGPRNMSVEQIKFVGEQHGLKGDYRYINPSDPSLGVLYKPEGEEDFQLINTPYATSEDVYNFLVQEAPAIAGDIGLTVWAARKMTPAGAASAPVESLFKKAAKTLGLSGAAALGATTGDWLRLVAGYQMGAHDMDPDEMLKEAGVVGAWAFAGTAVIGLSADAIIKAWKLITKTDVPPAMMKQIDQAYKDAAAREKGEDLVSPGILYGDEVSVKETRSQIRDLVDRYGAEFGKRYNPTMPAQAGTTSGADLETIFLKYADDPDLHHIYGEIKKGNQQVIDEFIKVLGEKIGPSTTGPATGATVSEGLRVLAQKDIDAFTDEAYEMIDKVRLQVGGAEDVAAAGSLIKQVDNPEASSGPIFERFQTRLNEIKKSFVKPFDEAWQKALSNERYANLTTGAGYTRKPTQDWLNANKGDANKLFKSIEGDEAVDSLFRQIPTGAKTTLNRLRGMGKKGYESPSFTLTELNDARVALNDFASNLPEHKSGIARYARGLERGLEKQMNQLLKEGASAESGIKITQTRALRDWMRANDYGEDLILAWKNQTEARRLTNSEAIRTLTQTQRPEKVAEYVLNTTAKGSRTNTPMTNLMKVLKKEGSDEVLQLQEGLAAYIRERVLDVPDKTPFQIAKKYRQFIKDHEGTLKAVFGEEKFMTRFGTVKSFNDKVIKTLDNIETDIARIEARFGLAKTGDPDKKVTNIVESILSTGETGKQSGRVLEDIEYLATILKRSPELQDQVAQVTKRYILQKMIKPRKGGDYALEADELNKLLTEGFGPTAIVGDRLTFESFMTPLLGKEGPEFVKNLRVLNTMIQRELGAEPSDYIVTAIKSGEYGPGANIEGARFLQRMLIAPLTQTGRRITALTNRFADNSRTVIGEMLLDQDTFNQVMRMMQGRESTKSMIRFFSSYGLVAFQDIGDELQYYDTVDKIQKTPEEKDLFRDNLEDTPLESIPYVPEILDMYDAVGGNN